jgi:hypothetical protein
MTTDMLLNRMRRGHDPRHLAILRIATCGYAIFVALGAQFDLFAVVAPDPGMRTVFGRLVPELFAPNVNVIRLVVIISGSAGVLGIGTRLVLPSLAISFTLLGAVHYTYFNAPVPWLYIWFPLYIVALAPAGDAWSVDRLIRRSPRERDPRAYRWPVEVSRAWFAYIYVAAGISKLLPFNELVPWITGSTAQGILWNRYLHSFAYYLFDRPMFDYSSYSPLFMVAGMAVIVIEISAAIVFFTLRFNVPLLAIILSMHGVLWMLGVPGFGLEAMVLGTALLPLWEKASNRATRSCDRGRWK